MVTRNFEVGSLDFDSYNNSNSLDDNFLVSKNYYIRGSTKDIKLNIITTLL